ncbi:hypothetical protein [Nocardia cyriacigeorgica]|uniref:hypothetical protein n=1 Tax=Nocardia cyriacigeorgica TaxID=135487 RepID=UPI001894B409|nr:hypothetical protein [Nocardia cyriacigeorgica]MBF6455929.1 hypothetical protein [Nocardia cyriacigeorgica]MBF6478434.1 hypothetical protein [Nocardia cyriacigeorgica]MBF6553330.1 hypothetical protein [Nocardia cyriacigeorgica]
MAESSEPSTSSEAPSPSNPSLVEYLDITYRMFGQDEPADMEMPKLPKMHLANPGIDEYTTASEGLILVADSYESVQQKAWEKVVETKEMTKTGRTNILDLIDGINNYAKMASDDASFFEILETGFMSVDGVREASTEKSQELGDGLRNDVQKWIKDSAAQGQKDREAWQKQMEGILGAQKPSGPAAPGTPGAPGAPGANNPGQNPPPWVNDNGPKQPGTTPDPTRPGTITPPGTTKPITPPETKPPASGVKPPTSDIKPPTTTPPISTPPRVNPPISSPSSPGLGGMPGMGMPGMGMGMPGMGMPGMGMGLPGMNDQLARRNELDRDLARRREELEDRRDKPRDVAQPKPAAQPAVAQQGQGAPGAPNGQQVNANSGATAAPGAGTPPPPGQAAGPVPNEKGLVPFEFTGRGTVWVSPVVHSALGAAVANKKGIDAKAAYANTPAKWNDDKTIGMRIDPSQLITGDVASWKDGTAIAVVWKNEGGAGAVPVADGAGPPAGGAEGTLEIVANGELQAVTGDIMKEDGPYGTFNGFFHPNGIDAVPPTDAGAAAPAPATADQQPTVVA